MTTKYLLTPKNQIGINVRKSPSETSALIGTVDNNGIHAGYLEINEAGKSWLWLIEPTLPDGKPVSFTLPAYIAAWVVDIKEVPAAPPPPVTGNSPEEIVAALLADPRFEEMIRKAIAENAVHKAFEDRVALLAKGMIAQWLVFEGMTVEDKDLLARWLQNQLDSLE